MAISYRLPVELLCMVMQELDAPGDLKALIVASTPCYYAFSSSPNCVLASVVENSFLPGAIRTALAVSQIPTLTIREESDLPVVEGFLDGYFDSGSPRFHLPRDMPTLTALCRLHAQLSPFIDEYLDSTHITRAMASGPLSTTERTRLHRAFLRYELYCRLFPAQQEGAAQGEAVFSSDSQHLLFLARLPLFEIEEMVCIHYYFADLAWGFVRDVEDQLVCAGRRALGAAPAAARRHQYGNKTRGELRSLTHLGATSLFPFAEPLSGPGDTTFFVGRLASLGLAFMRSLIDADGRQRRRMIQQRATTGELWWEFLPEALLDYKNSGGLAPPPNPENQELDDKRVDLQDHSSRANPGYDIYFWEEHVLDKFTMVYTEASPLRGVGYVFWDADRLRALLDTELEVGHLPSRRRDTLSVEERQGEVRMPPREMERIEREFGWY